MHFDISGNDSFLKIHCAPAQWHQTVFDLAFFSTGDEDVKRADLRTHDLLDQFQKGLSFNAFIKGVNDNVCFTRFLHDLLEGRDEIISVDIAAIGLARRIEPI